MHRDSYQTVSVMDDLVAETARWTMKTVRFDCPTVNVASPQTDTTSILLLVIKTRQFFCSMSSGLP